jgi:serine phosphatase RsbU (regulator of sigma subunit)/pSer/pThr/pTyr-binding forkhead associated (FHA) protein
VIKLDIRPADGERFELTVEDDVIIGRSARADVTIADRFLSRSHARLSRDGDEWFVEDLGSRNGTLVNGVKISSPQPVRPGDVIGVSASVVVVGGGETAKREAAGDGARTIFRDASAILVESRQTGSRPAAADRAELQRAAEQLRVLMDVHQTLADSMTTDEVVDRVMDRIFVHLQPHSGAVFLVKEGGLERVVSRATDSTEDEFPESQSLAAEVIDKRMAAVVQDTSTDERFFQAESLLGAGVRSLVAAPLLTRTGALGMIVLSSNRADRGFREEEMELLVVIASAVGLRIRNLALAEEAAERERFERDVALARRIQVSFLPPSTPKVAGWEIYGGNIPSRGVSGDYYQVVEQGDRGDLAVIIADVSGKGIAASLLTGYVDALCFAYLAEGHPPDEIFNRVSQQMNLKTLVESFATAFLGLIDATDGRLSFASAGHDPVALVRSSGEVEWLMPTGMPLALMPDSSYTASEAALDPGDTLVLYTDGITEAADPDDDEFGRDRLAECCVAHRKLPVDEMAAAIHSTVDGFVQDVPYHDDRTLVIVRRG